ncbi:MAG: aminotransferase class IV, partial [Pontiella sp.]|nr:aminotransferase class IV [Pontiella sp.]
LEIFTIREELESVIQALDMKPHRVRLLVSEDGHSEVQTFPLEDGGAQASAPKGGPRPSIQVALANEPVDSEDVFLYHKTTHRVVYESVQADFPDCDDVILWNEQGEVTESCLGNVVIRRQGRLITPPVACGLLAGVFRNDLLKRGEIEEGIVTAEDLMSADEVFLVNSVRKWQKAVVAQQEGEE